MGACTASADPAVTDINPDSASREAARHPEGSAECGGRTSGPLPLNEGVRELCL
jgi:hypothetical protein